MYVLFEDLGLKRILEFVSIIKRMYFISFDYLNNQEKIYLIFKMEFYMRFVWELNDELMILF